ncbi:acetate--CoA ligase family protein [Proteocatella sphenisci]|uniref:acetate--CoA ligase family protein n=1 Tax=Proteocatella sphenisci TaxID=181070 RepID=UPI00048D7DF5|nr:acetate--CoA ligase family protein [Proteocatella sphenisci]
MNLESLMAPKSVALIGASNKPGSLGHDMVQMIKRGSYSGNIYPVNPKYDEVCGIKCYPDLESIGGNVDLAVFCVAAKRLPEQIDIAVKNKVKSLTIFANCVVQGDEGFEDRIIEKCLDAGIPVLGHNAMGYYNNDLDLRICGFEAPDEGVKGNISMISQSGSVFSTICHNEPQLKFNLAVATGTGHITSLEDYMIYALEQKTTKVMAVYMESSRKPERFVEALKLAKDKKTPVVLMKVGKSELGAEFAKSHTGGLAGDDDAIQAVLDHYGVIRVDSLEEMANTLAIFSFFPEIPKKGGLVAIADSGGERNLLADDAEYVGIEYAELSEDTMEKLENIQEFGQHASNPLDPWGTGIDFEKIFGDSMSCMLRDENAAIGLISQDLRDGYYLSEGCVQALEQGSNEVGKPVVFLTNLGGVRRKELTEKINQIPAPVLTGTKSALKAVKNYLGFRDFEYESSKIDKLKINDEISELIKNKSVLKETDAMTVLENLGFPVVKAVEINSADDLEAKKGLYQYPLVLKTAEEGILHKADVGGVKLRIANFEELEDAYADMSERLGEKCIVAPMISFDNEIILGMKNDETFGPMVIVGAGGIYTELLKDRIVILPEASEKEIREKLKTLKTYKLFTGFRGSEKADMDLLIEIIMRFCKIVKTLGSEISEIDINPVAIKGNHIVALDALMIK